jgi:hypothetical protein
MILNIVELLLADKNFFETSRAVLVVQKLGSMRDAYAAGGIVSKLLVLFLYFL